MLIAFEGIDGSGKTTSSRRLSDALQSRGERVTVVQLTSFRVRPEEENPMFRGITQARDRGKLGPLSYATWHCADFASRLEELVFPALGRGEVVIMDRYTYTALVRDVLHGVDEKIVRNLYSFAPEPDLVVYLDVDPVIAYERKKAQNAKINYYERGLDLFANLDEREGFIAFQTLCRKRYDAVLPPGTLRLDATLPPESVTEEILSKR